MNDLALPEDDELERTEITAQQEWDAFKADINRVWLPFANVLRKFSYMFGKSPWRTYALYAPIKVGDPDNVFIIKALVPNSNIGTKEWWSNGILAVNFRTSEMLLREVSYMALRKCL